MAKYVLDTNVFVHAMRSERARADLAAWQRRVAPHLYMHAVVIAELLVGAKDEATLERWHERWVAPAERVHRVLTPSQAAWVHTARIVARLVAAGRLDAGSLRPGFFNDCLLAASARDHGFAIVTHNLADFRLIQQVEARLVFVAPFPGR